MYMKFPSEVLTDPKSFSLTNYTHLKCLIWLYPNTMLYPVQTSLEIFEKASQFISTARHSLCNTELFEWQEELKTPTFQCFNVFGKPSYSRTRHIGTIIIWYPWVFLWYKLKIGRWSVVFSDFSSVVFLWTGPAPGFSSFHTWLREIFYLISI